MVRCVENNLSPVTIKALKFAMYLFLIPLSSLLIFLFFFLSGRGSGGVKAHAYHNDATLVLFTCGGAFARWCF